MDCIPPGSMLPRDEDSSACAEPVAAVSCWESGPCRPRAASRLRLRHPGCARLPGACAGREIRKAAGASWREYLLFLHPSFRVPGNLIHRAAIAAFPWRRNAERFRPMDMREMAGSEARLTAGFLFGERLHDFFRRDGNFINPDSHGI